MEPSPPRCPPARAVKGFSLAELLVGLFLMSVAIVAAAPLFTLAMHGNASSRDVGWVGAAAELQLERLREAEYDTLVPGGSVTSSVTGYNETVDNDVVVRWQILDNSASIARTKILVVRAERARIGYGPAGEFTAITVRGD